MKLMTIIVLTLILLSGLFDSISAQQNILKVIDLTYKVRKTDSNANLEFTEWVPSSKADGYKTYPGLGEKYCCVQPVVIIQNVSDKTVNFRARVRFLNTNNDRIIYNRLVKVDSTCMALPDSLTHKCTGDPYVKVRYSDVTEQNGDYTASALPFPGPEGLNGIPPDGYVQIQFPPYEPGDYVSSHLGEFKVYFIADPTEPTTLQPIGDEYPEDDTLFRTLHRIRLYSPTLLEPPDSSKDLQLDLVLKWDTVDYTDEYIIWVSKNKNFTDSLVFKTVADSFVVTGLEPNTDYYWRVAAEFNGPANYRWSSRWRFTTRNNTDVINHEIINNQVIQYAYYDNISNSIKIKFELLKPENVRIDIYNILGQKIATLLDEYQDAGENIVSLPLGTQQTISMQAGVYFYCFTAGGQRLTGKMIKMD